MAPQSPIRILLVDDEPDYVASLARLLALQRPAFEVHGVSRLGLALEAIPRIRPDAILLDLALPDSRGVDTVRALLPHAGPAPVVVLSSSVTAEVRSEAILAGAQDAILKTSITAEGLGRVLVTAMDRVKAGGSRLEAEQIARIEWCIRSLRHAADSAEATIERADRLLPRMGS